MTSAETQSGRFAPYTIAVLLPCYNEAAAIAKVVADFRAALPEATVFVFDNNSTDNTAAFARDAGAEVFEVSHRGKGFVVRRMFTDVEADIYVLADGDATYDAASAPRLIERLLRAPRHGGGHPGRQRAGRLPRRPPHRQQATDRLRRQGVRAELQRHAVGLSRVIAPLREIVSGAVGRLRDRDRAHHSCARTGARGRGDRDALLRAAGGLQSKLNTWRDGIRILRTIVELYRTERPLAFFGAIGVVLAVASVGFAIPIFITYAQTGLVPRLPTAVLSTGLMLLAFLSGVAGLVLDTVTRGRQEMKMLAYLSHRAPGEERRRR